MVNQKCTILDYIRGALQCFELYLFLFELHHIKCKCADLSIWALCVHILCIVRAFDTLAKVLHSGDGSAGESLEATMQLMSGDQSGPVVELEGPLLSDSHIPFKVKKTATDLDPQDKI